jgi:DNA-binding ferritin-like protein
MTVSIEKLVQELIDKYAVTAIAEETPQIKEMLDEAAEKAQTLKELQDPKDISEAGDDLYTSLKEITSIIARYSRKLHVFSEVCERIDARKDDPLFSMYLQRAKKVSDALVRKIMED